MSTAELFSIAVVFAVGLGVFLLVAGPKMDDNIEHRALEIVSSTCDDASVEKFKAWSREQSNGMRYDPVKHAEGFTASC